MADSTAELQRQITLARTEIKNLRHQIFSLKYEHSKEVNSLKTLINDAATGVSQSPQIQPQTSTQSDAILYSPIGRVESSFSGKRAVPRQPAVSGDCRGVVVLDASVYNNPEHALEGLQDFSHMWILFHMHATDSNSVPAKVSPPRLRGERTGVLATRSPHRPCPIGLSLVKIIAVRGNRIEFSGVDMLNGSPVLDLKPYIPQYDYPAIRRPTTDGDNDAVQERLSPRDSDPLGASTPEGLDLPSGPGRPVPDAAGPRSPVRPGSERGAPDGQERFTPPQSANFTQEGIRVPQWIASTQNFEVRFTEEVNARLSDLLAERCDPFKRNLVSLLAEDPRSQYVRNRYPDDEYTCVLEDMLITCVFDASAGVCNVIAIGTPNQM